ncbi:putative FAD-containing monooxygenase [Myriangium duriaei CBS 260.36]|uniref:FAD-containing monooxygenase n=1 Tax=Myriangium duriaei CBS 260.36 TaxID=1168546 RepID=A0A9P4MFN5_9PEZI|nr:putative FAD-containing monooxygenase [Myriangium duriaei CBS 260.36]
MSKINGTNGSKASDPRLKVIIVGAGVSGILMAYKLKTFLPQRVVITVLEKNSDLGGTWFENRYPGCACDVPSHLYQFSFKPNPEWSQFFATSQEIQRYLKDVTQEFDLEKYIEYNTTVQRAEWDERDSIWRITVDGSRTLEADIFVNATGILNNPQIPQIPGLSSFQGPVLHTANWDDSVELTGKRVAMIGAAASAIQVLPKIQKICKHVDVHIRTPSWITTPVGIEDLSDLNPVYTPQQQYEFRSNPLSYLHTRKGLESQFNNMFKAFFRGAPEQCVIREKITERMTTIIKDEALRKNLIPDFDVGCRRINPGESWLKALQESNVTPIFDEIEKITSDGIQCRGKVRCADILITATGFNTTFRPRFPIIGRKARNLQDIWQSEPMSYMGIGVSGFPNYLVFLGPNTPISNGSVLGPLEATSDYFIRLLRKVIRERIKVFDIRPESQHDFDLHTQGFMKNMVWTGTCRSWFKRGIDGRVTALWPGSSLHYMQVLAENKWENYNWEYKGNRFDYWEKGFSWIEEPHQDQLGIEEAESQHCSTTPRPGADLSYYLWAGTPLALSNSPVETNRKGTGSQNATVVPV